MSFRANAFVVSFLNVGKGSVVIDDVRPEDLVPPGALTVDPADTPNAPNLRLTDGVARPRPGFKDFANVAATRAVNGLHQTVYDDGSSDLFRCDRDDIFRLSAGTWSSILGGFALTGNDADTWSYAQVRRASPGVGTATEIFMCNGVDNVARFDPSIGAVASVSAATFTAARALLGHGGRSLAMNIRDSAGTRRSQRIIYSIVGDPRNHTGTGAGTVDLDDDPWPIVNAAVVGGRVCVYKGSAEGGSIIVGTPTGIVNTPFRWEVVSSTGGSTPGVGLLLPRTLLNLSQSVTFFVGHDGFYLHDGGRGLRRIMPRVTRHIVGRVSLGSLRGAFAYYRRLTNEVVVGIPTAGAEWPTEYWVYHLPSQRVYGPWVYTRQFTAASLYQPSGDVVWDAMPDLPWDTSEDTPWDFIGGAPGTQSIIFGAVDGYTGEDGFVAATDDGTAIAGTYYTPAFRPNGQALVRNGAVAKTLDATDTLTLQEVTLITLETLLWTPTIEVSTDGGRTWTSIGNGVAIGNNSGATGRTQRTSYTTAGGISGTWFQIRVTGDYQMQLHSIQCEYTYAGDARNA